MHCDKPLAHIGLTMLRKRFSCTPYICLLKKKIGSTSPKKKNRQWLREFCAKQENRPYKNNKKSSMIRLFLCEARRQKRSILDCMWAFWHPTTRAKRTHQNDLCAEKSSMIEGILCQTRKSPRSILSVCEERFIAEWCKIHQSERFWTKKMRSSEVIRLTREHLPQS